METETLKVVSQFGIAIAIIFMFFIPLIWWFIRSERTREEMLTKKLDEVQSLRIEELKTLRDVTRENIKSLNQFTAELDARPCLLKTKYASDDTFKAWLKSK